LGTLSNFTTSRFLYVYKDGKKKQRKFNPTLHLENVPLLTICPILLYLMMQIKLPLVTELYAQMGIIITGTDLERDGGGGEDLEKKAGRCYAGCLPQLAEIMRFLQDLPRALSLCC